MKKLSLWKILKEEILDDEEGLSFPGGHIGPSNFIEKYNLTPTEINTILSSENVVELDGRKFLNITEPQILNKLPQDKEEFASDLESAFSNIITNLFGSIDDFSGIYQGDVKNISQMKQDVSTSDFRQSREKSKNANYQRYGSQQDEFSDFDSNDEVTQEEDQEWENQWSQRFQQQAQSPTHPASSRSVPAPPPPQVFRQNVSSPLSLAKTIPQGPMPQGTNPNIPSKKRKMR